MRPFLQMHISDLTNDALTQLLLYGDQDLFYDLLNKNILESIRYQIVLCVAVFNLKLRVLSFWPQGSHCLSLPMVSSL